MGRFACARWRRALYFQARKWTDLQSAQGAQGHKDAAHACDDVKVKGRRKLHWQRAELPPLIGNLSWIGRWNWVQAHGALCEMVFFSPFFFFCRTMLFSPRALSLCASLQPVKDTSGRAKSWHALLPRKGHVHPICVVVTSKPKQYLSTRPDWLEYRRVTLHAS